jgi:hypothetical protein
MRTCIAAVMSAYSCHTRRQLWHTLLSGINSTATTQPASRQPVCWSNAGAPGLAGQHRREAQRAAQGLGARLPPPQVRDQRRQQPGARRCNEKGTLSCFQLRAAPADAFCQTRKAPHTTYISLCVEHMEHSLWSTLQIAGHGQEGAEAGRRCSALPGFAAARPIRAFSAAARGSSDAAASAAATAAPLLRPAAAAAAAAASPGSGPAVQRFRYIAQLVQSNQGPCGSMPAAKEQRYGCCTACSKVESTRAIQRWLTRGYGERCMRCMACELRVACARALTQLNKWQTRAATWQQRAAAQARQLLQPHAAHRVACIGAACAISPAAARQA